MLAEAKGATMAETDRLAAHFAGLTRWHEAQLALRALLLEAGLSEAWKWHAPVYTHDGHNVAIIWGFKDRAALGFFKGALLDDPACILAAPGPHSRSSRVVNVTTAEAVAALRPTLLAYLAEAMRKAAAPVPMTPDDLDPPAELLARLEADPALAEAFADLTPGRRRGWMLLIGQAKQAQTRLNRIDRAAPRILAGKGPNER